MENGQFKDRLKLTRLMRGMTQRDLAKATGLQSTAISFFETGLRLPCFENMRRLALALDVSADYLLGLPRGEVKDELP